MATVHPKIHVVSEDPKPMPKPALDVSVLEDGSVVIHASAAAAACLAGREIFGDVKKLQAELENKIADAWYAAGCPPVAAA